MDLRNQENALFDRWQTYRPFQAFVPDGLFDEATYRSASKKVLFVLKDAYGDTDGGNMSFDIRDYGKKDARGHTWGTLARWAYGLQRLDEELDWETLYDIGQNREKRLSAVLGTGLMNLKKECSPQATTDKSALADAAKKDKDLIAEQWQLYLPDITVCGSWQIFDPLCEALNLTGSVTRTRGTKYAFYNEKHLIIEACHPAAQYPAHMKYYMVRDVVAKLL